MLRNSNIDTESSNHGSSYDETDIVDQLTQFLASLNDTPAKFAVGGTLQSTPLPGLCINNVGPISVPLCDEQAKKIIAVASKAPYGRGEKTILDEGYRKTWELQPYQVSITNIMFNMKINEIVSFRKKGTGHRLE